MADPVLPQRIRRILRRPRDGTVRHYNPARMKTVLRAEQIEALPLAHEPNQGKKG